MDIDFSVLEGYRHRVIKWRDSLLFPADVAIEALNECKQKDIRLLGLDAFGASPDDAIQYQQDGSLDLSGKDYWDYSVAELCDIAMDYVWARNELLFEFVEA
jgi:hypothetical protein